jgi:acyl-[acyl-carrier-protein] desaturase
MVDDRALLAALTPRLHELVERHLEASKEWFPHELVPWSRGRDFEPGEAWDANEFEMADGVRSALFVNLLTEDNLPHYFETINRVFADEAWRVWARRWTAEEMRHSTVIRDYATVTRALDPVALERARMSQVAGGVVPQPTSVIDGLAYVALQELATRVAHRNTGKLLDDEDGYDVMARGGADENLHYHL